MKWVNSNFLFAFQSGQTMGGCSQRASGRLAPPPQSPRQGHWLDTTKDCVRLLVSELVLQQSSGPASSLSGPFERGSG